MPLSPYATRPYCLDSEFLPRHLLAKGLPGLTPEIEHERGKSAYREFIRSLIFSPQVVVGRESVAGHPVLANAVNDSRERGAIESLLANDRLYVLLMVAKNAQGERYEEKNLVDFIDGSHFRKDAAAAEAWKSIASSMGDAAFPYVRLNLKTSVEMESRFTAFFKTTTTEDPALVRLFEDSLGEKPTEAALADFKEFWREDLRGFTRHREDEGQETIFRSTIYDEYFRPKNDSKFLSSVGSKNAAFRERRKRLQQPFKLITDLAYNANAPTTLGIHSFVPPDLPDPSGLPAHLFRSATLQNASLDRHRDAVRDAYVNLVEQRTATGEHFFYASQEFQRLPDIGSFTIRDTVMVMKWPEWMAFKSAQNAAMRFENAEELPELMKDYWLTTKSLYERLDSESRQRQSWRRVSDGSVKLAIAVTAHIMGHAVLPEALHAVPWWAAVTASTTLAIPIHAGLDIIVHGLGAGGKHLLPEIGHKDGGMREFHLSDEMKGQLERLRDAEARLSEGELATDSKIAEASNRIASEG